MCVLWVPNTLEVFIPEEEVPPRTETAAIVMIFLMIFKVNRRFRFFRIQFICRGTNFRPRDGVASTRGKGASSFGKFRYFLILSKNLGLFLCNIMSYVSP